MRPDRTVLCVDVNLPQRLLEVDEVAALRDLLGVGRGAGEAVA